jgi:hypothetical protein
LQLDFGLNNGVKNVVEFAYLSERIQEFATFGANFLGGGSEPMGGAPWKRENTQPS